VLDIVTRRADEIRSVLAKACDAAKALSTGGAAGMEWARLRASCCLLRVQASAALSEAVKALRDMRHAGLLGRAGYAAASGVLVVAGSQGAAAVSGPIAGIVDKWGTMSWGAGVVAGVVGYIMGPVVGDLWSRVTAAPMRELRYAGRARAASRRADRAIHALAKAEASVLLLPVEITGKPDADSERSWQNLRKEAEAKFRGLVSGLAADPAAERDGTAS
jgi:hypothetical protein